MIAFLEVTPQVGSQSGSLAGPRLAGQTDAQPAQHQVPPLSTAGAPVSEGSWQASGNSKGLNLSACCLDQLTGVVVSWGILEGSTSGISALPVPTPTLACGLDWCSTWLCEA